MKQIYYQVYFRFSKKRIMQRVVAHQSLSRNRTWLNQWCAPFYAKQSCFECGEFRFLNHSSQLSPRGWNDNNQEKLWLYNLHYFDDLCAIGSELRCEQHKNLIYLWIEENPPLFGNGWEPYPLSLRVVNWVKFLSQQSGIDKKIYASLHQQSQALYEQIEFHILANHLFANIKGLLFTGAFFQGGQAQLWLLKAKKLLIHELDEQFLDDGAHFERSPMYHNILLWDLCDILFLVRISDIESLTTLEPLLIQRIRQGLHWCKSLSHPDGEVSFFNDSTIGISPNLAQLIAYAEFLGIKLSGTDMGVEILSASGFACAQFNNDQTKLLMNIAPIAPSYQPGHAHADTLSFELSHKGQRVFVNSGVSTYEKGAEREYQRSTVSHNTVSVGGYNSSEVWAGFRVARRAVVTLHNAEVTPKSLKVDASHNGYHRIRSGCTHRRYIEVDKNHVVLKDSVSNCGDLSQVAYFYLHPDILIEKLNEGYKLSQRKTLLELATIVFDEKAISKVSHTKWFPEFGVSRKNCCIEVVFSEDLMTTIKFN